MTNPHTVSLYHQGVTVVKPIVYGNLARPFGKKREEDGHTHQWTVYAKPYKYDSFRVASPDYRGCNIALHRLTCLALFLPYHWL